MGITKDPRKDKIRELKQVIKEAYEDLTNYRTENQLTPDSSEEKKKTVRASISTKISVLQGLEEEMKNTRMNKNSSSAFSFTPTPGMNRQQRKIARNKRRI